MILGLASPTYAGAMPAEGGLAWLLDRCGEYGLRALEASLPTEGGEDAAEVGRRARDKGIIWIGYWSDDWVTPADGVAGLGARAARAFDRAVAGGVETVVVFGNGAAHNRFTHEPPLAEQLRIIPDNLRVVAEAAAERGLQLGLLPHLDYRGHELVVAMQVVGHPALQMAFDTTNPFPVCEEPVDAARAVLPHAVAVALKDVQIYPHRSNDVTIWGAPLGAGSVDFVAILPLLAELLPAPEATTACVKLRLPPDGGDYAEWMEQSLRFLRQQMEWY